MANGTIKRFPLKMGNGTMVRNIDDLRKNADVKTITERFLNGKLKRWLIAYGHGEMTTDFDDIYKTFITSILERVGVSIDEKEIDEFISSGKLSIDDTDTGGLIESEEEEDIADDDILKEKLGRYADKDTDLTRYRVQAVPINDDKGNTEKYRVNISDEKTKQYTRFLVPYRNEEYYTKELFEKDICRKIYNNFRMLKEQEVYNSLIFASLKVGDTFVMGRWEGKPLEWIVAGVEEKRVLCLSKGIITKMQFNQYKRKNGRKRKWIKEFGLKAFTPAELDCITEADGDKITLLRAEEAQNVPKSILNCGSWWWLRSPGHYSFYTAGVNSDGDIDIYGIDENYEHGVRLAFNLDLSGNNHQYAAEVNSDDNFDREAIDEEYDNFEEDAEYDNFEEGEDVSSEKVDE